MINPPDKGELEQILDNPIVRTALNREEKILPIINQTQSIWTPRLEDCDDFFTLLLYLADNRLVINIPNYGRMTAQTLRSDQYVVAKENRHGQIFRLGSNLENHSMPLLMFDYNVVTRKDKGRRVEEKVGFWRYFGVTKPDAKLHDGWDRLEFRATAEDEKYFRENGLNVFRENRDIGYFIAPDKFSLLYTPEYLATRILAYRMADEARHLRRLARELRKEGITPAALNPSEFQREDEKGVKAWREENGKPKQIRVLETKLVLPEMAGEYPIRGIDEYRKDNWPKTVRFDRMPEDERYKRAILSYCEWLAKKLSYTFGPRIRVPTRAIELGFFVNGFESRERNLGSERLPEWDIPNAWMPYKLKRTHWHELPVNRDAGVSLLMRVKDTKAYFR